MARKIRLEFPGACYHVINRGNYRRGVFAPKGAAESFEQMIFATCARFGWRLHAYVIMRNHFHLALETPEPNLSAGMKWLQATWAMRFNRFRGETGRPFQGRYKALHVEPGHALAQVAHYIHLNPARAKVVTAERLPEFRWSSLEHFPKKDRPEFFCAETVLLESGGFPDTKAGWRRYVGWLALMDERDPKKRKERQQKLSRGWCVGSPKYRAALRKDLAKRGVHLEKAERRGGWRAAWLQERGAEWEERLQLAAKVLKVDLRKLPKPKSAPAKVRLAALLKATSAVTNGWLAERLDMGQPASASQFVRRFHLGGGANNAAHQRALGSVFQLRNRTIDPGFYH